MIRGGQSNPLPAALEVSVAEAVRLLVEAPGRSWFFPFRPPIAGDSLESRFGAPAVVKRPGGGVSERVRCRA